MCIQGKESIRGKHWFLDNDLKSGTALKVDKTGKAILTVLRHLGRLAEVGSLSGSKVTHEQLFYWNKSAGLWL